MPWFAEHNSVPGISSRKLLAALLAASTGGMVRDDVEPHHAAPVHLTDLESATLLLLHSLYSKVLSLSLSSPLSLPLFISAHRTVPTSTPSHHRSN